MTEERTQPTTQEFADNHYNTSAILLSGMMFAVVAFTMMTIRSGGDPVGEWFNSEYWIPYFFAWAGTLFLIPFGMIPGLFELRNARNMSELVPRSYFIKIGSAFAVAVVLIILMIVFWL